MRYYQAARIGKYVDATAPLAKWLRGLDLTCGARDALHVAEQRLKWQAAAGAESHRQHLYPPPAPLRPA